MKHFGVFCKPGSALLFFSFRFEYLISDPKSYRDFGETSPWPFMIIGVKYCPHASGRPQWYQNQQVIMHNKEQHRKWRSMILAWMVPLSVHGSVTHRSTLCGVQRTGDYFFKKKMKFLVSMTKWMEQDTDTLMLVISNDWTTFPV